MTDDRWKTVIANWFERQTCTCVSNLGAGVPIEKAYHDERWIQWLSDIDIGVSESEARKFVEVIRTALVETLGPLGDTRARVNAANQVFDFYKTAIQRAEPVREQPEASSPEPAQEQPETPARLLARADHTIHMVYLLFDETEQLLYVGITSRGPKRLAEHYRTKAWFGDVCATRFEWYESREEIESRERYLIQTRHPLHNIQHNNRISA